MSRPDNSVYVRIRPVTKDLLSVAQEEDDNAVVCWCPQQEDKGILYFDRGNVLEEYRFHRVFSPKEDNESLFNEINTADKVTRSVFEGVNETIFGYGQTSSGKTHSVFGSRCEVGLIHHFIRNIFNLKDEVESNPEDDLNKDLSELVPAKIEVRCFEIFGDTLTDLIDDHIPPHHPTYNINGEEPDYRQNERRERTETVFLKTNRFKYKIVECEEPIECLDILDAAIQNRKSGVSSLNARSSRSHAIVQLTVTRRINDGKMTRGTLTLIDLAGSEREDENPSVGEKTTCRILNTSLSSLARLLRQLQKGCLNEADKRQSVLNKTLFEYVQPSCGIFLIFCVNPLARSLCYTTSTLQMAVDSKNIRHKRKQTFLKAPTKQKGELRLFALDNVMQSKKNTTMQLLSSSLEQTRYSGRLSIDEFGNHSAHRPAGKGVGRVGGANDIQGVDRAYSQQHDPQPAGHKRKPSSSTMNCIDDVAVNSVLSDTSDTPAVCESFTEPLAEDVLIRMGESCTPHGRKKTSNQRGYPIGTPNSYGGISGSNFLTDRKFSSEIPSDIMAESIEKYRNLKSKYKCMKNLHTKTIRVLVDANQRLHRETDTLKTFVKRQQNTMEKMSSGVLSGLNSQLMNLSQTSLESGLAQSNPRRDDVQLAQTHSSGDANVLGGSNVGTAVSSQMASDILRPGSDREAGVLSSFRKNESKQEESSSTSDSVDSVREINANITKFVTRSERFQPVDELLKSGTDARQMMHVPPLPQETYCIDGQSQGQPMVEEAGNPIDNVNDTAGPTRNAEVDSGPPSITKPNIVISRNPTNIVDSIRRSKRKTKKNKKPQELRESIPVSVFSQLESSDSSDSPYRSANSSLTYSQSGDEDVVRRVVAEGVLEQAGLLKKNELTPPQSTPYQTTPNPGTEEIIYRSADKVIYRSAERPREQADEVIYRSVDVPKMETITMNFADNENPDGRNPDSVEDLRNERLAMHAEELYQEEMSGMSPIQTVKEKRNEIVATSLDAMIATISQREKAPNGEDTSQASAQSSAETTRKQEELQTKARHRVPTPDENRDQAWERLISRPLIMEDLDDCRLRSRQSSRQSSKQSSKQRTDDQHGSYDEEKDELLATTIQLAPRQDGTPEQSGLQMVERWVDDVRQENSIRQADSVGPQESVQQTDDARQKSRGLRQEDDARQHNKVRHEEHEDDGLRLQQQNPLPREVYSDEQIFEQDLSLRRERFEQENSLKESGMRPETNGIRQENQSLQQEETRGENSYASSVSAGNSSRAARRSPKKMVKKLFSDNIASTRFRIPTSEITSTCVQPPPRERRARDSQADFQSFKKFAADKNVPILEPPTISTRAPAIVRGPSNDWKMQLASSGPPAPRDAFERREKKLHMSEPATSSTSEAEDVYHPTSSSSSSGDERARQQAQRQRAFQTRASPTIEPEIQEFLRNSENGGSRTSSKDGSGQKRLSPIERRPDIYYREGHDHPQRENEPQHQHQDQRETTRATFNSFMDDVFENVAGDLLPQKPNGEDGKMQQDTPEEGYGQNPDWAQSSFPTKKQLNRSLQIYKSRGISNLHSDMSPGKVDALSSTYERGASYENPNEQNGVLHENGASYDQRNSGSEMRAVEYEAEEEHAFYQKEQEAGYQAQGPEDAAFGYPRDDQAYNTVGYDELRYVDDHMHLQEDVRERPIPEDEELVDDELMGVQVYVPKIGQNSNSGG